MGEAHASNVQSNFLGGEWAPLAQGRIDSPDYRKALGTCLNAIPLAEGAWTRRGGFLSCGATHAGWQGIIRPFLLPNNTPCYLEITYNAGGSILRFWVPNAAQTAFVRMISDIRTISAISTATPAEVTVTATETWATGNDVTFSLASSTLVGSSYALLQQREFTATVIDSTHFTIADAVTGASVNGTTLAYSSSGSDTVSPLLTITLPYTTLAAVQAIRLVKADNLAILLCPGYAPQALYYNGTTFVLTAIDLTTLDGPYLDPLVGSGLSQLGLSSGHVNADWISTPTQFTIDDGAYTFTANDVGKSLRLWTQPPAWSPSTNYATLAISTGGDVYVTYEGSYWIISDFGGAAAGYMPVGTTPGSTFQTTHSGVTGTHIPWIPAPGCGNWLTAKITRYVSGTTVGISLTSPNSNPLTGSQWVFPYAGTYHTADMWQLSVIGLNAYPVAGAYRQGRLYLGGAQSNRADLSMADALDPFKITVASGTIPPDAFSPTDRNNNVGDANAVAAVMNDAELNSIFWFAPIKSGVVAGTPGGEFLIDGSTLNDALTPATVKADKVSTYKSANVEPLRIGVVVIFVQAAGRELLEYFADAYTGQPVARPLNEFAKHMTLPGVAEIRYQHERIPIVWCRGNDNSFFGCTYRRFTTFASPPPEFYGWHRHAHGGSYAIESICTGPTPNGAGECLMAIVNVGGVRQVEMMTSIMEDTYQLPEAMHVDGAVTVSGSDNNSSSLTLYGLNQYAGLNVDVWLAGLDCGTVAVSTSGTATVPYGSDTGGFLTAAYLQTVSNAPPAGGWLYAAPFDVWISGSRTRVSVPCVVGFTFTSQGKTLPPLEQNDTKTPSGASPGMTKRTHMYAAMVTNTAGISFGADFNNLIPASFQTTDQNPTLLLTNQMKTGVHQDTFNDDYSYSGALAWQVTRPYPATVNMIAGFVETQERD